MTGYSFTLRDMDEEIIGKEHKNILDALQACENHTSMLDRSVYQIVETDGDGDVWRTIALVAAGDIYIPAGEDAVMAYLLQEQAENEANE